MGPQVLTKLLTRHTFVGVLFLGCMLIATGGNAQAQAGSELALLDHEQGEVLVDVYDARTALLRYVDVPLEEYVKNTLPGEWFAGYDDESALEAGAVAIRSYALNHIDRSVAIYDGESGQNYVPGSSHPRSDAATNATDGLYMATGYNSCVDNDASIEALYADETGNPTEDWTNHPFPLYPYLVGVADEHTQQSTIHPGMCQLGSQWYATDPEHLFDHTSILQHYYTGWSSLLIGGQAGGCINGDVNCDCAVDVSDAAILGGRYGINNLDPSWDSQANLAKDGTSVCSIDILDLTKMGANFDFTCPW